MSLLGQTKMMQRPAGRAQQPLDLGTRGLGDRFGVVDFRRQGSIGGVLEGHYFAFPEYQFQEIRKSSRPETPIKTRTGYQTGGQMPSRSRIAYHVIASTSSGARSASPPGKDGMGIFAIRSNRSACPATRSASSFPAMVAIATPWPE